MGKLREMMKRDLAIKRFSKKTQECYLSRVRDISVYYNKSPDKLTRDEIKDYLHYLIEEKKYSSSYVNQCYSALKFFFEITIRKNWMMDKIPRTKRFKKIPVVLDKIEIQHLFNVTFNLKHRTILVLIYSAGLRISEALNLKVHDIDQHRMKIFVRAGKGGRDRYAILAETSLVLLRQYWNIYRPKEWLFPGPSNDKPISASSVQKVFKKSLHYAGIKKPASVHTLRHSFATHLMEANCELQIIQKLMGHKYLKTTALYTHVSDKHLSKILSPVDSLFSNKKKRK